MNDKIKIVTSDKLPPGTVALVSPGKAVVTFDTERTEDATIITARLEWLTNPSVAIVKNVAPRQTDATGEGEG